MTLKLWLEPGSAVQAEQVVSGNFSHLGATKCFTLYLCLEIMCIS